MVYRLVHNLFMVLLVLSILALTLGPILFKLFSLNSNWLKILDGFMFVSIGWIVCGEILPQSVDLVGWPILLYAIAGLIVPFFAEKIFHHDKVHQLTVLLAMGGLLIHSMVDGTYIAHSHQESHYHLAIGVLLHRIPVGLAIWWIVKPNFGVKFAVSMLTVIALGSVVGFSISETLVQSLPTIGFELFQALVAGSLLHVMIHSNHGYDHDHKHDHHDCNAQQNNDNDWYEGIGNIIALLFLIALSGFDLGHKHEHVQEGTLHEVFQNLIELSIESAPALVSAYLIGGLATSFLKESYMKWMAQGRSWKQSLKGIILGLPLPICSCGVVPLYQALIKKGAPPAAAVAFLIATPELGIDAILISLPLLGPSMTIIRLIGAITVALLLGMVVGRMIRGKDTIGPGKCTNLSGSLNALTWREKLKIGLKEGLIGLVDNTGPWIVFGLLLAAGLEPILEKSYNSWQGHPQEVLFFGALGLPIYVCASGATPLVAVFLAHGVSPGAALAFLLTGPATNVTTFGVLSRLHGKVVAFALGFGAMSVSVLGGYLLNTIYTGRNLGIALKGHHAHNYQDYFFLIVLLGLYAYSIGKRGARRFIKEIFIPHQH